MESKDSVAKPQTKKKTKQKKIKKRILSTFATLETNPDLLIY